MLVRVALLSAVANYPQGLLFLLSLTEANSRLFPMEEKPLTLFCHHQYLLVFIFLRLKAGDPRCEPLCKGESHTRIEPDLDSLTEDGGELDEAKETSRDSIEPPTLFPLSTRSRMDRSFPLLLAPLLIGEPFLDSSMESPERDEALNGSSSSSPPP